VADTWVYVDEAKSWMKASQIPELKMFFRPKPKSTESANGSLKDEGELRPGVLRRIKVLADMDDHQLAILLKYAETISLRPFTQVVRRAENGEHALYGVLEGELRSSILVESKECPLATLPPGSLFGEISFIDHAPHTADVLANQESLVVKFTAASFENIMRHEPAVALAFLHGLTKSLAGRVRTLTRRFEEAQFGQFAEVQCAA